MHDAGLEKTESHNRQEIERLHEAHKETIQASDQRLKKAMAEAGDRRVACRMASDEKAVRAGNRNERLHRAKLGRLERDYEEGLKQQKAALSVRQNAITEASEGREKKFNAEFQTQWQALESEWKSKLQPLYETIASTNELAEKLFPSWTAATWENWKAPGAFAEAAQFGELIVNYYRCYRCSHQWVDVYPAEPDDVCTKCQTEVHPYKSEAYMEPRMSDRRMDR